MKVLVTGGAGYIGSVSVDALIAAGHEVVVFDNLYMGHRAAVNPKAAFVEGDLADKAKVSATFAEHKPQAIMHFASYSLVGESMENPLKYLGDNVTNALNLLNAAVEFGVERFILSSTANLFDEPETLPISETERIVPGSPYGESKAIIERYLFWLQKTKGLRYAALRYFNAAGCTDIKGEDHQPESHLIPLVIQVALGQREKIMIFGDDYDTPDGTCVRDYIHVSDLASAHILAMEALSDNESLHYNLGNGSGFSVKEAIETVREVSGHPIPAEITPRRAGDPASLVGDSSKIRSELGWAPQFADLKSIVESAWKWHVKHPKGYED
ncbi:UDP-glucose 4-epimerase GalE [Verrucomicrobiales bacterium]|nr:UDP-glucose 4-epimerase GalE [Verrucomicrobiales bacterium]MDC0258675.1 UDP-glucose 4-epimerase GalE [Verrucomicrobiales bacterium]